LEAGTHFFAEESYRMVGLADDGPYDYGRGVCLHDEGLLEV